MLLLFQRDQVSFEQFRMWIFNHPNATIITKWLLMEEITISLSNDTDTPTFYQTLSGVTHCKSNIVNIYIISQVSTLTYFSTCPFGQLTKKSTCPTQSFSCSKKIIKITKTRE